MRSNLENSNTTKKAILDALESEETTFGNLERPVLPLVGSLNVDINNEEEKKFE